MSAPAIPARRGDVVVMEFDDRTYTDAHGYTTTTTYAVTKVLGVSSTGRVVWVADWSTHGERVPMSRYLVTRWHVVHKEDVNVAAVLRAQRGHTWPGRPDQPMRYGDIEEVKAVLRKYATGLGAQS